MLVAVYPIVRRGPAGRCAACGAQGVRALGLLWGLSYVFLFEAFSCGRVSIVSLLVAVESLVGVVLAALLLSRTSSSVATWIGAALIVTAGMIGAFR